MASTQDIFATSVVTPVLALGGKEPQEEVEEEESYKLPSQIDHVYHGYYSIDRQQTVHVPLLQQQLDTNRSSTTQPIVAAAAQVVMSGVAASSSASSFSSVSVSVERERAPPTLVLNAGVMGSGKTHVWRRLLKHWPQQTAPVVHDDPDRFKSALPEAAAFSEADPQTAGSRLHRESCYLSERLLWEALARNRSIILEGTLRDVHWNTLLIARIRQLFPHYRIVIFHVTAPRAMVLQRVQRRCLQTKRCIPPALLDACIAEVPAAIDVLRKLVAAVVTIDNARNDADDAAAAALSLANGSTMDSVALLNKLFAFQQPL